MIGIQIISHGKLSEGMVDSLRMILGTFENVEYNMLKEEISFDDFKEEVLKTSGKLMGKEGLVVFVDMFGATPYNAALYNSKEFTENNYAVITGFNLPILVEAITSREFMDLDELVRHLESVAGDTIVVGKL